MRVKNAGQWIVWEGVKRCNWRNLEEDSKKEEGGMGRYEGVGG